MKTLGEILAEKIELEKKAASDKEAALMTMQTAAELARFKVGEAFFEKAKRLFTEAITSMAPVNTIQIQAGGARFTRPGTDCNPEFDAIWGGYRSDSKHPEQGPYSLSDPKLFAALWIDFKSWCKSEGLEAYWCQDHDGGGMDSWWLLKIRVATPKAR